LYKYLIYVVVDWSVSKVKYGIGLLYITPSNCHVNEQTDFKNILMYKTAVIR